MIIEAFRMFKRRFTPFRKINKDISKTIIESCWNGKYLQVSSGHFSDFYARDFGICVESLLNLGYNEYVEKTLIFALDVFKKNKTITTTITKQEKCKNFFGYPSDSFPFLLRSLRLLNNKTLTKKYRSFLESYAKVYKKTLLDKTGLVKKGYFSSMKDHYKRNSSCYDNCMVEMARIEMDILGYSHNFKDRTKLIENVFWFNDHFVDDASHKNIISGDAQVFPFYCGVFDDQKMFTKCVSAIQRETLDSPFPLKYTKEWHNTQELFFPSLFAPNYEGTAIWIHLGLCYMQVTAKYDKKLLNTYLKQYDKLLTKHKNFLEVYTKNGKPYKSAFYKSDENMSWIVMYESLQK